ncbi:putative sulfate transporter 3.5 [Nicotiana tabacum]|uniref:Sulfate transporter 3.5 n=1 Tax=Nicotiana tabacum TaxID=4097 RepID=A0A1S4DHW5_TOBAC|nr:PREDICTED: probable sulfate transporter 3.5 [Nicotiana tabacum]
MTSSPQSLHRVNYAAPRSFGTLLKANLKETLFPDDPFHEIKNEPISRRFLKGAQYFVPIFEWLPKYSFKLFKYDLLAGITIASLAIPQGISYAKLANIPPIIGLYSSFVPPLIYAVFGSSKHLAVGTVAACSLLIAAIIEGKVNANDNMPLYLSLVFTATLFSGLVQTALGLLRLGILVDFLSHSTITGFMGGTAIIICLQQLKGMLGLKHFTTHTDVASVLRAIFHNRKEWKWESAVVGIIFLTFLQFTRFVKNKKPKLFWVSAIAPMVTVIVGCLFAYFAHADKHGIQIVGHLSKGINPSSIHLLNFDPKYISAPIKAGVIAAMISLAEGIAIGRSFAIIRNEQIDGNKEMIAIGLMNIFGSFASCYLTTGPFSKTAVNFNAGCKTAMSNVVMSICMMLTLLFLAPLFSYTPLVSLSAIIMSAMLGLIDYDKAYHLFKTDKFDFCICMAAFFGVSFISMDIGLMLSVGLALIRALLYIARPATCKLGLISETGLYRDVEQYPDANGIAGILILKLGSPIYFANCNYIRERILRWIRDERSLTISEGNEIEFLLLELGGITSIDITGVETLLEIRRCVEAKGIKMILVNPRLGVLEKLMVTESIDTVTKESVFLTIEDAIDACRFSLKCSDQMKRENLAIV